MNDPNVLVTYTNIQLSITNISNISMMSYHVMLSSSLIGQNFSHLVSQAKLHKAVKFKAGERFQAKG